MKVSRLWCWLKCIWRAVTNKVGGGGGGDGEKTKAGNLFGKEHYITCQKGVRLNYTEKENILCDRILKNNNLISIPIA